MEAVKGQHYFKDMDFYIQETPSVLLKVLDSRKKILKEALSLLTPEQSEILLLGSGSSFTAAQSAKYYMQRMTGKNIVLLYSNNVLRYEVLNNPRAVAVAISQSGNSVAAIEAVKKLRGDGYPTIALTQDMSSDVAKNAEGRIDISCGEESCGPKTKGYSATVLLLMLLSLEYALREGRIGEEEYEAELTAARQTAGNLLQVREDVKTWYDQNRERMIAVQKIACVGYGANYGTAMEGSLKLIETVRCPAFGYEFEEYLHGPNDGIDLNSTIFLLGSQDEELERMKRFLRFASGITSECFLFTKDFSGGQDNLVPVRFLDRKSFCVLEYAVVLQYLAYRISRDRAVDLNTIKYPEYYTIMNCKTKI